MFLDPKKDGEQTTKTLEPWRQLLLDAADYMEVHGHCINVSQNDKGAVCIIGALDAVKTSSCWSDGLFAMDGFLRRTTIYRSSEDFNDTHTGPEVIAAMRACARAE